MDFLWVLGPGVAMKVGTSTINNMNMVMIFSMNLVFVSVSIMKCAMDITLQQVSILIPNNSRLCNGFSQKFLIIIILVQIQYRLNY